MEAPPADPEPSTLAGPPAISPRFALALAAWFGLLAGFAEAGMIVLKKDIAHASLYYNQSRDFAWVIPLGNLAVLLIPGVAVAAANRARPGLVSLRAAAWVFAALALWAPCLKMPLAGPASLLLCAGLGRVVSRGIAGHARGTRRLVWITLPLMLAIVVLLGETSTVGRGQAEHRTLERLPEPPRGAGNVLLIVLDTVRAESLGLYGYSRDTTPNLERWAKKGIRFDRAIAAAPWTLPSHGTLFTGRWPYQLNLHWQTSLDRATPTLAEYLASKGYATAGFSANTNLCSYETGLDRGFAHFEDYPSSPRAVLGSTAMGRWLVEHTLGLRDQYALKWLLLQSRGADQIVEAMFGWLGYGRHRRADRPFFVFLNFMDAHEPFVVPDGATPRFGLRPQSRADSRLLIDYWERDKLTLSRRDVTLVRDAYDDCIAYLDHQVGALLDQMDRGGRLRDTTVIITSDHGEQFGEHGVFNHGYSLYLNEVHVPLVIIPPSPARSGLSVREPVSLRDVPATIVDLLGLSSGSPLPGRSLARYWRDEAQAAGPAPSPVLSEVSVPPVLPPRRGRGPTQRGFAMSVVVDDRHYIRDGTGAEWLFDLGSDPRELRDVKDAPDSSSALARARGTILRVLTAEPPTLGLSRDYLKPFAQALGALISGAAAVP